MILSNLCALYFHFHKSIAEVESVNWAISCKTLTVRLWYKSSMQTNEWTKIWHNAQLDLRLLQAYYVQHAYPRHSHDYYVISLIEQGRQSFTYRGTKHR